MPSDVRIVVVLPEPFGPSRPKIVPASTFRSRPSRIRVVSNVLTNPRQLRAYGGMGAANLADCNANRPGQRAREKRGASGAMPHFLIRPAPRHETAGPQH